MKLLLDLGATSIKCALIDNNQLVVTRSIPSPSRKNYSTTPDQYTIPASVFKFRIETLLDSMTDEPIDAVYICSEMHGCVCDDTYISWKDSRADIKSLNADNFFNITGMKLRAGIAYASLMATDLTNPKVGTLMDTFLQGQVKTNITMAAAMGLVDKNTNNYSDELIKDFQLNSISTDLNDVIGYVNINNKQVPAYAGIGDLQSALVGAGIGVTADAVLNLGTGSQVACVADNIDGEEIRPMPDGSRVKVITHIPCGRALNILAAQFGEDRFWTAWELLTAEQVLAADYNQAQLSFFESAWQYGPNSGFVKFKEGQTFTDLIAAIAHRWVTQYITALTLLDPDSKVKTVALSGGVSHKSKFIIPVLEHYSRRKFFSTDTITGEETLDGLLKICNND